MAIYHCYRCDYLHRHAYTTIPFLVVTFGAGGSWFVRSDRPRTILAYVLGGASIMWPFQTEPTLANCTLDQWQAFFPVFLAFLTAILTALTGFYMTVIKPLRGDIKTNTVVTQATKDSVDANTLDRAVKSDVSNQQLAKIAEKVEAEVTVPPPTTTIDPVLLDQIISALRAQPAMIVMPRQLPPQQG